MSSVLSQVALILEDGYSLSYRVENNRNLYTWPQGEGGFFLHPACDIISKLPAPEYVMVGSRLLIKYDLTKAKKVFKQ